MAQRALGFAGRAAGVIERRQIIGAGKTARRGTAGSLDGGEQIDAVPRVLAGCWSRAAPTIFF
jgi:hypothetical protein